MKKIKKLEEIALGTPEMKKIIGGKSCDGLRTYNYDDVIIVPTAIPMPDGPNPTAAPAPSCGCGCCGCAYQDGGSGFSLGMVLSGLDGYSCTWFSIF